MVPSQELLVIRQNHKTGERSLNPIKWGLIPYWCQAGRKPINAKAESVAKLPTFRDAYAQRRCIVPVDGSPQMTRSGHFARPMTYFRLWSRIG
jgi:putative SOS response-associated peptidase YedK